MKEHKAFVRAMDDTAFEIAKGTWGLTINLMLNK